MKLNPQQIPQAINNQAIKSFILHGDEPFLMTHYADQILSAYNKRSFEIHRITIESNNDWQQIAELSSTYSLFSDNQLFDCRYNKESIDAQGKKVLCNYLELASIDCLLLLRAPKLKQTTFLKKYDKIYALIKAWPLKDQALIQWIRQRLNQENLQTSHEGYRLIADFTEGNLLACDQAIEKLSLLHEPGQLSLQEIESTLSMEARYDIFKLADSCLAGDLKATQILHALQRQGIEPTLILWSLCKELRLLIKLHWLVQQSNPFTKAFQTLRLWDSKKSLYQHAYQRLSLEDCYQLLQRARRIDDCIKGLSPLNSWQQLHELCHALSYGSQTCPV